MCVSRSVDTYTRTEIVAVFASNFAVDADAIIAKLIRKLGCVAYGEEELKARDSPSLLVHTMPSIKFCSEQQPIEACMSQ